jgi:hypothetical protein
MRNSRRRRRSQNVLRFSMRHDRSQSQRPRKYADPTTFFNCVRFSSRVETIRKSSSASHFLYNYAKSVRHHRTFPTDRPVHSLDTLSLYPHSRPPTATVTVSPPRFTCRYLATLPAVVRTFISPDGIFATTRLMWVIETGNSQMYM